jgi:hypothetical protein
MQQSKDPSWAEQLKMIQEIVEEKLERRSYIVKIVVLIAGVFLLPHC